MTHLSSLLFWRPFSLESKLKKKMTKKQKTKNKNQTQTALTNIKKGIILGYCFVLLSHKQRHWAYIYLNNDF